MSVSNHWSSAQYLISRGRVEQVSFEGPGQSNAVKNFFA